MLTFSVLFLLLVSHLSTQFSVQPFVLNRVSVVKNLAKQTSVRVHGHSSDLVVLHAILRFSSSINQHHNALLIDQSSLAKYKKIMVEETNKITVSSRTVMKTLCYHTTQDNQTSDANGDGIADKLYEVIRSASLFGVGLTPSVSYDGVLLLDEYSAIWNDYNVMVFSRSLLTFLYHPNGSLSATQGSDYSGATRFTCDPSFESDHCLVHSPAEGLEVNGRLYPTYRIVLDLDSPTNYLPIDLFLLWRATETRPVTPLSINLGEGGGMLHLNRQFVYEMHQSNVIILGIDVIHYFPRVEYSVANKEFLLFFNHATLVQYDTQQTIETLFVFLNLALLVCLFVWGTSYNYQILNYMIRFGSYAKTAHFFAFKQVIYEVIVIIIAVIVIIVSLAVDDADPAWTAYESRKVVFIVFILYHVLITLGILIGYVEPNACVLQHYFSRLYNVLYVSNRKHAVVITPLAAKRQKAHAELEKDALSMEALVASSSSNTAARQRRVKPLGRNSFQPQESVVAVLQPLPYQEAFAGIPDRVLAKELHSTVVGMYHDPVIELYTPVSIIRNLAFITTLLVTMALLFNFYTPLNNIYLLLIVGLSFALIYFEFKYLAVVVVYLSLFYPCGMTDCEREGNKWLVLFMIGETIAIIVYVICSYDSVYVTYFNYINSTHSPATVSTYILTMICILALLAVTVVTMAFDKYADPIIDDAIEECEIRKKLRLVQ